jgi:hypothetical protein
VCSENFVQGSSISAFLLSFVDFRESSFLLVHQVNEIFLLEALANP